MKEKENDGETSVFLQYLIEETPSRITKWGMLILLVVFLIFMLLSWVGKYPDSIEAEITIVAKNPRNKIFTKTAGRLHFLVREGEDVKAGQFVGYLNNTSENNINMFSLINYFDTLFIKPELLLADNLSVNENIYLEDLQIYFEDFIKKKRDYFTFIKLKSLEKQRNYLSRKLYLEHRLKTHQENQNSYLAEKIEIEKVRLSRAEHLYNEKVIANSDLQTAKESAIDKIQNLEEEKKRLLQLQIVNEEIEGKIQEINSKIVEDSIKLKGAYIDAFRLLYSKLKEWSSSHLITSPCDGKIYFFNFWSNGQYVDDGKEIISIVPFDENIFGVAKVPILRSGEIKNGQKVFISLENYIPEEYGIIEGEVLNVSPVPDEESYRLYIKLDKGLSTSYHYTIPFAPEIQGKAEIITKDTRIIEKIFYKFRKHFNRRSI